MIRDQIKNTLLQTLKKLNYTLPDNFSLDIEAPKDETHGDFSSNIALALAKPLKKNPREIAARIKENIAGTGHCPVPAIFEKIDIAGAGFINFYLKNGLWHNLLKQVIAEDLNYGKIPQNPDSKKINLEFVSVNPTGPMHVAHGRWAVLGDSIANVLLHCGEIVTREYYVNDSGNQVDLLGKSLKARYLQALGQTVEFPEKGYYGAYLTEFAEKLKEQYGDSLKNNDDEKFRQTGIEYMMNLIKECLKSADVVFDKYFFESGLHKENVVNKTLDKLKASGHTYEKDGAVFFKSTSFGDDKDRVLVKEDGQNTYFLADIAYHLNKLDRGFDILVNIWGADHHGYINRMKASLAALGFNPDTLQIIIGQLVTLTKAGALVKMSKRSGEMVTFQELLDEVGKDAVRFIYLTKSSNSNLEFDIELAKTESQENPVYYVQYAHARICSILRNAREVPEIDNVNLALLAEKEEIDILKKIETLPGLIRICGKNMEVHQLTHYSQELSSLFHSFYNKHKVLNENDKELTYARLYLIKAIKIILNLIGKLLGVEMPESM